MFFEGEWEVVFSSVSVVQEVLPHAGQLVEP